MTTPHAAQHPGHMRTLLLALLLATAHRALPQHIPLITDIYPGPPGQRTLELRGLFADADTVLLQVYHDSDLIAEVPCAHTWNITLGEYDWYILKFTAPPGRKNATHRVKYLGIFELNSEGIEYVPEILIEFGREGDLLLVKPSDGKPDFIQIDVGLSRSRR